MSERWWSTDPAERFWVEIRREPGIGISLYCPTTDSDGGRDPWYELVAEVKANDVIYHWSAREHRFVGRSIAASDAIEDDVEEVYEVPLRDFTSIAADISLTELRSAASPLYAIRDQLRAAHGDPLHLPFQFKKDRRNLAFMSNYFAKLPKKMVSLLFGPDELAGDETPVLPVSPGNARTDARDSTARVGSTRTAFLQPFRPKADTDYVTAIPGGVHVRTKRHESLVNDCAEWLISHGYEPGRNAAVDLGLDDPPVVIEAKIIGKSWAPSIREAVGQLYEYRFFKVADPKAHLIFLASEEPPPHWVSYLERDRHIGSMWPRGSGFAKSKLAAAALRTRRGASGSNAR